MTALDAYDREILRELARNARLPAQTLANRVGLSRNAVRLRIQRMERDKVIGGYTLRAPPPTAEVLTSVLLIQRRDRMRGGDVLAFLKKTPEVRGCWVLSGQLDILAVLQAPSQQRLREIWQGLARLEGAADITTAFALDSPVELT